MLAQLVQSRALGITRMSSFWDVSSVGSERMLHTHEVTGSNPVHPTLHRSLFTPDPSRFSLFHSAFSLACLRNVECAMFLQMR